MEATTRIELVYTVLQSESSRFSKSLILTNILFQAQIWLVNQRLPVAVHGISWHLETAPSHLAALTNR